MGVFYPRIQKQQFCQNMFHPIFSLYAAIISRKKSEKLNASISYKTNKKFILGCTLLSVKIFQKNHYINFNFKQKNQKSSMQSFFENTLKTSFWAHFEPKTSKQSHFQQNHFHQFYIFMPLQIHPKNQKSFMHWPLVIPKPCFGLFLVQKLRNKVILKKYLLHQLYFFMLLFRMLIFLLISQKP